MMELTEDISNVHNRQEKHAIGVFNDHRNAFHTVDHKILFEWANVPKSVQLIIIMYFVSQNVNFIFRFK